MNALTLVYHTLPSDAEMDAATDAVRANGGTIRWQASHAYNRAYALVERLSAAGSDALRALAGDAWSDRPIIALAVLPSVPEALPPILHALGGTGAPAGIRSCERSGDAAVVEWDLERTGADLVLALIDTEISRFRARRVNELLTPLPLEWTARIAAAGLGAREIAPDRILEALLETMHVVP